MNEEIEKQKRVAILTSQMKRVFNRLEKLGNDCSGKEPMRSVIILIQSILREKGHGILRVGDIHTGGIYETTHMNIKGALWMMDEIFDTNFYHEKRDGNYFIALRY